MFSQHGSTGDGGKLPLHSITNIKVFKVACIDMNSLYTHEIHYILMLSPLEVLAISESRLDNNITDGKIPGKQPCLTRNCNSKPAYVLD